MPKFKIEMELTSINERILLTDYDSNKQDQNGVTFNENLSEEENDQYRLSFSIAEEFGRNKTINIGLLIAVGRPIWLYTYNPNRAIRMVISSFSPVIGPENTIYEIEAQDYASYAFARNNAGLTLDTIEDEDFADWMKQRNKSFPPKIEDIANHILQRGWLQRPNGTDGWSVVVDDWEPPETGLLPKSDIKLNYAISDSNTYNGLIELANYSNTFLEFDYINEIVYFVNKESDLLDKGYTLRRDFNIQNFGLTYSAQELYSIFYVQGGEDELGRTTILSDATAYQDNFLFNFNYFKDRSLVADDDTIETAINNTLGPINNSLISIIRERLNLIGRIRELETQLALLADTMMLTQDGGDYMSLFFQLNDIFFRRETDADSETKTFSTPVFTAIWSTLPQRTFVFSFPATINYDGEIRSVASNSTVVDVDGVKFTIDFVPSSGAESTTTNGFTFYYTPVEGNVRENRLSVISSLAQFSETVTFDVLKPIYPYLSQLDLLDGQAAITEARARWQAEVDFVKQLWDEDQAKINSLNSVTDADEIAALEKIINEVYRVGIGGYNPATGQLDPKRPGKFTIILSLFDEYAAKYNTYKQSITPVVPVLVRLRTLEDAKKNFWYNLKKDRQHIFVEGYYDNDIETSAVDLKTQAEEIYKSYQKPLEDFNIAYIDVSDIVGVNITDLRPGDYVTLKEDKLEIQQNRESRLRVATISRVLRDKGNISLAIYRHNAINHIIDKLTVDAQ